MSDDIKKRFDIPMLTRQGEIGSFNSDSNTAEMVFSESGAQVRRFDFFEGEFIEELSLEPGDVDLSRVDQGTMPFLRDHGSGFGSPSIGDVLGRIIEARVDGEKGVATVEFSEREDVQGFIRDIKSGILKSVSVGFRVNRFEKVGEQDGVPILRVVEWELLEISSVAIPADAAASFRNAEKHKLYRCEVIGMDEKTNPETPEEKIPVDNKEVEINNQRNDNLNLENQSSLPDDNNTGENLMDKELIEQTKREASAEGLKEGVKAEKERQQSIREACEKAGMDEKFTRTLLDGETTVDAARTAIIDALAEKAKETNVRSTNNVEVGEDNSREARITGARDAFLHRAMPEKYEMTDKGRQFSGAWSVLDMARRVLRSQGVDVDNMSKVRLAERALHTTSDFPEILANTANKSLRDAYQEAPQTFQTFTRRVQVADFKEISRTQLGDAPDLLEVPESGEIKHGSIGEAAEKYSVKEYARMIAISRKTLVNDDLGAFTRIPELMGRASRDLESDLIYNDVKANPTLSNGNALFSAGNNNIGTAGAISITTLNEGRAAMRSQVGLNNRLLNIMPIWMWVPTALESVAEQFVSSIQPDEASKVNPFGPQGRTPLQIVVEPRLDAAFGGSDTAWYLSASLSAIDMYELATLEGTDGPEIMTEELFDTLGMKIRVVHNVGVKAIDFRGLFRNAGV